MANYHTETLRQYAVQADSVADLLNRYYKKSRYTGRGEVYAKGLLASYERDFANRGYCYISHWDNVSGDTVTWFGADGGASLTTGDPLVSTGIEKLR